MNSRSETFDVRTPRGDSAKARRIAFDSIHELRAFCEANAERLAGHGWDPRSHEDKGAWYGSASPASVQAMLEAGGNEGFASDVGAILRGVKLPDVERLTPQPVYSVAGGIPVVPAFLAGDPLSMIDIQEAQDDRAPIRIFVDIASSAAIDAATLRKRGACCVALLQILQRLRPVELYSYCGTGASIRKGSYDQDGVAITVRMQTPLSVAEVGMMLCWAPVARGVCYAIAGIEAGFTHAWPFNEGQRQYESAQIMLRAEKTDLIIAGMDSYSDAYKDPVAWLLARMREVGIDTASME